MQRLVSVRISCGELDVPTFLRKMAEFAEKNHDTITEEDYYEYSDNMGVAEFDYE